MQSLAEQRAGQRGRCREVSQGWGEGEGAKQREEREEREEKKREREREREEEEEEEEVVCLNRTDCQACIDNSFFLYNVLSKAMMPCPLLSL
ncbi:hypothetical protein MARPO_0086s0052 [Marchantia polymorpha]|uniref:Uncharacterized protein n=1 Tax=Marchantia polymorpha TaxID=3197 RepID=A0A2R6WIP4_MARPO|nr:hypothetical protein MARPO_0086s0052 [Marchantia polymorpha]|eukprot:PTQ33730.1 hypothetical protein MARPO_0086s0052 [Marchantia polymorpha]